MMKYKVYVQLEKMATGEKILDGIGGFDSYSEAKSAAQIYFAHARSGYYEEVHRTRILRIEIAQVLEVAKAKKMEWEQVG